MTPHTRAQKQCVAPVLKEALCGAAPSPRWTTRRGSSGPVAACCSYQTVSTPRSAPAASRALTALPSPFECGFVACWPLYRSGVRSSALENPRNLSNVLRQCEVNFDCDVGLLNGGLRHSPSCWRDSECCCPGLRGLYGSIKYTRYLLKFDCTAAYPVVVRGSFDIGSTLAVQRDGGGRHGRVTFAKGWVNFCCGVNGLCVCGE